MPNINWTWFLVGIAFAMFVLPMIMGFVQSRKVKA